jgi:hypothetical protein
MRRFIQSFRPGLQAMLPILATFLVVLVATFWLAGRQPPPTGAHTLGNTALAGEVARPAPPGPDGAPVRGFQQSPPGKPAPPPAKAPVPGVGKSPVSPLPAPAAPKDAAPKGAATATPVPDEVVLDVANNPLFVGLLLLLIIAVFGGFLWFWTRQRNP